MSLRSVLARVMADADAPTSALPAAEGVPVRRRSTTSVGGMDDDGDAPPPIVKRRSAVSGMSGAPQREAGDRRGSNLAQGLRSQSTANGGLGEMRGSLTEADIAHLERIARENAPPSRCERLMDMLWEVVDVVLVCALWVLRRMLRVLLVPYSSMRKVRERGWMLSHESFSIALWEKFLALTVLYSAFYIPLEMVFESDV